MNRSSVSLGKEKHVFQQDEWYSRDVPRGQGRVNFKRDILEVMKKRINKTDLIKILKGVMTELKK